MADMRIPMTAAALLALLPSASIAERVAPDANAQICDQRDAIVASLAEQYGEAARSMGLDNGGNLLEIFASDEGTWTAILTSPRGQACIVGAGEALEQVVRTPAISS
jgi:hypothetical protein